MSKRKLDVLMLKIRPYKWPLHLFEKEKCTIRKIYNKMIAKEKLNNNNSDKIAVLKQNAMAECMNVDHEIDVHITEFLLNEARRLMIEIPRYEDTAFFQVNNFDRILTIKGIAYLNVKIRKEKKETREPFISYGSLIVGIIGATTGLIAVLFTLLKE